VGNNSTIKVRGARQYGCAVGPFQPGPYHQPPMASFPPYNGIRSRFPTQKIRKVFKTFTFYNYYNLYLFQGTFGCGMRYLNYCWTWCKLKKFDDYGWCWTKNSKKDDPVACERHSFLLSNNQKGSDGVCHVDFKCYSKCFYYDSYFKY
jgi:hypothetical protein